MFKLLSFSPLLLSFVMQEVALDFKMDTNEEASKD